MGKKIWMKVTTSFEGVHYYKNATGDEEFLKHPHRHVFHLTVKIQQYHTNRDIEYIHFKRWLDNQLDSILVNGKSCEMLCDIIYNLAQRKYMSKNTAKRDVTIEVLEDGENGAIVEYTFPEDEKDRPDEMEIQELEEDI